MLQLSLRFVIRQSAATGNLVYSSTQTKILSFSSRLRSGCDHSVMSLPTTSHGPSGVCTRFAGGEGSLVFSSVHAGQHSARASQECRDGLRVSPTSFPSKMKSSHPSYYPTSEPTITKSTVPSNAPSPECHDLASYRSPLNDFTCYDHRNTNCSNWKYLGLTDEDVLELYRSCPQTCGVECGYSLSPSSAPSRTGYPVNAEIDIFILMCLIQEQQPFRLYIRNA